MSHFFAFSIPLRTFSLPLCLPIGPHHFFPTIADLGAGSVASIGVLEATALEHATVLRALAADVVAAETRGAVHIRARGLVVTPRARERPAYARLGADVAQTLAVSCWQGPGEFVPEWTPNELDGFLKHAAWSKPKRPTRNHVLHRTRWEWLRPHGGCALCIVRATRPE